MQAQVLRARCPTTAARCGVQRPAATASNRVTAVRRIRLARTARAAQVRQSRRFTEVVKRAHCGRAPNNWPHPAPLRVQDSVETADATASSDTDLQPMAASLLERAKLVVETRHVDDAFSVSRAGGAPVRPPPPPAAAVEAPPAAEADPAAQLTWLHATSCCRITLCRSWRQSWRRCARGRSRPRLWRHSWRMASRWGGVGLAGWLRGNGEPHRPPCSPVCHALITCATQLDCPT